MRSSITSQKNRYPRKIMETVQITQERSMGCLIRQSKIMNELQNFHHIFYSFE